MLAKDAQLYDLTQHVQGAVFQAAAQRFFASLTDEQRAARPQPPAIFNVKGGYAESPGWMMVQAVEFDPEPLTVAHFRRRAVYSSPSLTQALLELLASEKLLDRRGDGYVMTAYGRDAIYRRLFTFRREICDSFYPLPIERLQRLRDLTGRIIQACLGADEPDTWCIAHSRNRAPDDAPLLTHFIQFCGDLNAFRDDCHMSAFGAYDVAGHIWEAFGYLADGKAHTVADLYEQLAYRGFYSEDWQAAVDHLLTRNWIVDDGGYHLTASGQSVRDDVEARTDALFYAPFTVLNDAEFDEWVTSLQDLLAACQP